MATAIGSYLAVGGFLLILANFGPGSKPTPPVSFLAKVSGYLAVVMLWPLAMLPTQWWRRS